MSSNTTITIITNTAAQSDYSKATPTSSPNKSFSPVFSKRIIIIISAVLTAVVILVIVLGAIHCIRHRNRRKLQEQLQTDIEKSLKRAQRPVLALDTDIPRETYFPSSANTSRVSIRRFETDTSPVSLMRTHTAPPVFYSQRESPIEYFQIPLRMNRSPTRNSARSLTPGMGGRMIARVSMVQ